MVRWMFYVLCFMIYVYVLCFYVLYFIFLSLCLFEFYQFSTPNPQSASTSHMDIYNIHMCVSCVHRLTLANTNRNLLFSCYSIFSFSPPHHQSYFPTSKSNQHQHTHGVDIIVFMKHSLLYVLPVSVLLFYFKFISCLWSMFS